MDDIILARALHVISVVHWIGGVAFVTLVALPLAISRGGADGWALLHAVERRFSRQVRLSILVAGASGLWMTYRMDVWYRFRDPHFWWMSAMLGLWILFLLIVFIVEPLSHKRFERIAEADPTAAMQRMARIHAILLTLAAVTVVGAVAGAQGLNLF